MLLHKMPQRGLSLFTSTVPKEVYAYLLYCAHDTEIMHIGILHCDPQAYYQVVGEAVTKDCEVDTFKPKFMVKMPKPDKFLSPEDFKELLVQEPKSLGNKWIGNHSELNWIFLLAYSVRYWYMYTSYIISY